MKKILLTIICSFFLLHLFAQVDVVEGSVLNNEEEDKLNRMIDGEEGFFYIYRINSGRYKNTEPVYFIEKYDKSNLNEVYSREVEIPLEYTKIEDVIYIEGAVFLIYRTYDKLKQTMTLHYKTVSEKGVVSDEKEILSKVTDHYEYIDFDIIADPQHKNLAVKCTYKPNKVTEYKTDFVFFDGKTQSVLWTKTVDKYLKRDIPWFNWNLENDREAVGLLGFSLENTGDIIFAYNEKLDKENRDDKRYHTSIGILKKDSENPIEIILEINPEYFVNDMKVLVKDNTMIIAGFFKDLVERRGRDYVDVGIFSYKINTTDGSVLNHFVKNFDEQFLEKLESNKHEAENMAYKLDYILSDDDGFFIVGEQYTLNINDRNSGPGFGGMYGFNFGPGINPIAFVKGGNPAYYGKLFTYRYMDIIVVRIDEEGSFKWIQNAPIRNNTLIKHTPHMFKQYIAITTENNLYLLYNSDPKNLDIINSENYNPKKLKSISDIDGSDMVYSKISYQGKLSYGIGLENDEYHFAPIQERDFKYLPPENTNIFIPALESNEIIIYMESDEKNKFGKIKLK